MTRRETLILTLSAVAFSANLFAANDAFAGKEVFVRTKPHVNVGTYNASAATSMKTQATNQANDGAILVVSPADGPMPKRQD